MSGPTFSVVIPSYNYGAFVTEAIDSALAQTQPDHEVIVVDDGSTDDTRARVATYGEKVRYIFQANRGLAGARNTGIAAALGEWVALLDSDDIWHPQKLALQLRTASELRDVPFIGSPPSFSIPRDLPANPPVRRAGLRDFLTGTPVAPSSVIVRRRCFDEVGAFDESLKGAGAEDREMWLRLVARYPAAVILAPCFLYRSHEAQLSRRQLPMQESLRHGLETFFRTHPQHRSLEALAWAFFHLDTCLAHMEGGDRRAANKHLLQSFRNYPLPLRGLGAGRWLRGKLLLRLVLGTLSRSRV